MRRSRRRAGIDADDEEAEVPIDLKGECCRLVCAQRRTPLASPLPPHNTRFTRLAATLCPPTRHVFVLQKLRSSC